MSVNCNTPTPEISTPISLEEVKQLYPIDTEVTAKLLGQVVQGFVVGYYEDDPIRVEVEIPTTKGDSIIRFSLEKLKKALKYTDRLFADLKAYGLTDEQVWDIIDDMAAKKARKPLQRVSSGQRAEDMAFLRSIH